MNSVGFFQRLALAFRVLFDGAFAARLVAPATTPSSLLPSAPANQPRVVEKIVERERIVERVRTDPQAGALMMLTLLQREGRLVDFLMEDIASASDVDVGAAARAVHQGCQKLLRATMQLAPVRGESEGATIVLEAGFDANLVRLSGNVTGVPPYRGTLAHSGWRASNITLPQRPADIDATVVAPAEVEL